ncbi:MAG: phospholipase D-like domain-containing protein [Candidatus Hodarchaeota archaeon]
MNRPPELEIALILAGTGITPNRIFSAISEDGGILTMETLNKLFQPHDRKKIMGIISVALQAGAIKPVQGAEVPLESRKWIPVGESLNNLISDATAISKAIPFLKSLYTTDNSYSISATIPERFADLERFYGIFENTALGMRKLIEATQTELLVMIPFIDEAGFLNISESIGEAIRRRIKVKFISRNLMEGHRNCGAIADLLELNAKCNGNLQLFEGGLDVSAPISHAKIISRDGGDEVYIGSANLTKSSMETTIEVGVFLRGSNARPVHDFVCSILKYSVAIRM